MGNGKEESIENMSLRDYFAGQAMQGFILREKSGLIFFASIAGASYDLADAMLKERTRQTGEKD
jgi:hypothetical protein